MNVRAYLLTLSVALLSSGSPHADVYKCPGPKGTPIFTDKPCIEGERSDNGKWLNVQEEARKARELREIERQQNQVRERERKERAASSPSRSTSSSPPSKISASDDGSAGKIPPTPIESDAMITNVSPEQAYALAILVRLNGYKCDSISAARPFVFSQGFNLTCNNFRYSFELADKGGRWVVTVD